MSFIDIVILGLVVLAASSVIVSMLRKTKKGCTGCSCSCSGCSGCKR